jgi:oxygen-independent coproporphyrinogen-3 oxidase
VAGIYIHIPFCKQACNYCDFHFATTLRQKDPMIQALIKELELRANELSNEYVETIYFGGGTPSILPIEDLATILSTVHRLFHVVQTPELTLEANPDDISITQLQAWKSLGVNRLSIGIQSFHEEDLRWMNRAHNTDEALQCVQLANQAGITDISIDLIYGLPNSSFEKWNENLQKALALNVPHISAYGLTIEPQTNFGYLHKVGKLKEITDDDANEQFDLLVETLTKHGYEHYEISNFALPNRYSKHNTSYWQGKKYLGIGPSAHSFNGHSRSWNSANNRKYTTTILNGKLPTITEELSSFDKYNDFILTQLRTKWGVNLNQIKIKFGADFEKFFTTEVQSIIQEGWISENNGLFRLTKSGKKLADHVCMRLFKTD